MKLQITKTERLQGEISIPSSKSHTIRAVIIASLSQGVSTIISPLFSEDTKAAINACRALGASIIQKDTALVIEGFGASPRRPEGVLDMLNSGTSTNLIMGILAALGVEAQITGDASLQKRPVGEISRALSALGSKITFLQVPGYPPLKISGRIRGGSITIDAGKSSQYVSSLLLACPLLEQDTEIIVKNPTELPYIEMTLHWLDEQHIAYERNGFHYFKVFGAQMYKPFTKEIPADWSSATFPICAAAITDSDVLIKGVDIHDVQGDRAVVDYLKSMGTAITVRGNTLRVQGCHLEGRNIDINSTPDALPALSVVGCYADGETKLFNVLQARVKETDRIKVMAQELKKMGALVEEYPDGLLIKKSKLKGTCLSGQNDHRVVMALSLAGLIAESKTIVDTAEAVSVTYPNYIQSMNALGAKMTLLKEGI